MNAQIRFKGRKRCQKHDISIFLEITRKHYQLIITFFRVMLSSAYEMATSFCSFANPMYGPPLALQLKSGGDMCLQEKGRVLRLIVTLVGRATERESIFPVKMTHHCRSLTSMGAGTVIGLEGRPVFTRPTAVWKHLERLRTYGEAK